MRLLAVRWAILAEWPLNMPTDNISSADPESAVARFRAGTAATSVEALLLPNWDDDDWKQLFRFTSTRRVPAGEALIRRGEPGRTLYFVLHGQLEVIAHSGDGLSLGRMAVVSAGSVLGEQAFFDARPRSAGAWAVDDCEVAAMSRTSMPHSKRAAPPARATCSSHSAAYSRCGCAGLRRRS